MLCGNCGKEPVIVDRVFNGRFMYTVKCSHCGCHLSYWYDTKEKAMNSWNTAWKKEENKKC